MLAADQDEHIVSVIADLTTSWAHPRRADFEAEEARQDVIRAKTRDRVASLSQCTQGCYNGLADVQRGMCGAGVMDFLRRNPHRAD